MEGKSFYLSEKTSIWGSFWSSAPIAVLVYLGIENVFISIAIFVFCLVFFSILDGIYCRLRDLLVSKN